MVHFSKIPTVQFELKVVHLRSHYDLIDKKVNITKLE